jgi:hypothetical protein
LEERVVQRTEELEEITAELEAQNTELQETYHKLEAETSERLQVVEELRHKELLLIGISSRNGKNRTLSKQARSWMRAGLFLAVPGSNLNF